MATDPGGGSGESTPLLSGISHGGAGDAHQTTVPLLGLHTKEAHQTLTRLGRRISAIPGSFSLRRNSMRGTERVVPAMGKLGSFLFLSNLITGAWRSGEATTPCWRRAWRSRRRARARPWRRDTCTCTGGRTRHGGAGAQQQPSVGAGRSRRRHFSSPNRVAAAPVHAALTVPLLLLLLTGPGMLAFPAAYQEGGWLLGVFFTLLFMLLTVLTSTYMVRCVEHFKQARLDRALHRADHEKSGAHDSTHYVEYDTLIRTLRNRALLVFFQVSFICSMCMLAISCICIVSRALDNLSITAFGNAYGLQILPEFGFRPSCRQGEDCRSRQAFQDTSDVHGYVITQGYLLTMVIAVPFSLIDINDWFQGVMYVCSLLALLEMICVFSWIAWSPSMAADRALYGGGGTVPAVSYNVGLIIEVCLWSWAIQFAIPMWMDEKADDVSTSECLWLSCLHRGALDIMLGLSGAAAFPGLSTLSVLDELRVRPDVGIITELCGIAFAITALVPNVVDYQMAVSRNLELHMGASKANWLGVGLPYAVAWVFYFGNAFNILVNSTSVALNGIVELILPTVLFLVFSTSFRQPLLRMCGYRTDVHTWRNISWGVLALICTLCVLSYVLNACVRLGLYGPGRKRRHAQDEEDYRHYAAYSDLNTPPAPIGGIAPAPAPAPGASPAVSGPGGAVHGAMRLAGLR